MSDKEFLMDVLEYEKNLTVNTAYALNEASTGELYKEFLEIFMEVSNSAKELFTLATNLGYYQLEEEPKTKIKNAIKTLTQELVNTQEN